MRSRFVRAALAALATIAFAAPVETARAQGGKALVYCPVGIDDAGCNTIVAAIAAQYLGGVDKGYDGSGGTIDLAAADLGVYSVFIIPSLADDSSAAPYGKLRDPAIAHRLHDVLLGRIALWSGTPDVGSASRSEKDGLIRSLASWSAGNFGNVNGPGLVALLDQSENTATRYDWLQALVDLQIVADTAPNVYSSVRTLDAAGAAILDNSGVTLSYGNMATFGFYLPAGAAGLSLSAVGQTGTSFGGQVVLVTSPGGNPGTARIFTDRNDYAPGDTVTMTGVGFQPGEGITITLHEDPMAHADVTLTATADGAGNWTNTQFVTQDHHVGVRFIATALGSAGSRAQTTFTDDNRVTFSNTAGGAVVSTFGTITAGICRDAFVQSRQGSGLDNADANRVVNLSSTPAGATFYLGAGCAGSPVTSVTILIATQSTAFSFNIASANTYTITGDGPFSGANDATATVTVNTPANVATSLSLVVPSPASVPFGSTGPVTLSATLTRTTGGAAVVGATIDFTVDGPSVGTAVTNGSGVASITTYNPSALAVGNHTVQASFAGQTISAVPYTASTSGTQTLAVTPANTTTSVALTAGTNPSTFGDALTFTATVTGTTTTPTGTVTFYDGGTCGSPGPLLAGPIALVSGQASFSTSTLSAVAHTILACYSGNASYNTSSGTIAHSVNQATPTITWANPADITYGTALSGTQLNATASVPGTFVYTPASGTVLNAGNGQTLHVDFTPTDAVNYTTANKDVTINVLKKLLTAAIIGDPTKVYDGNTNATLAPANFQLTGLVGTESFTVTQTAGTYNSKDVATAATVSATLAAGDFTATGGALAANYTLPTSASGPGHITPKTLTAAVIGDPTKVYDGNTNATLAPANFQLTGLVGLESFSVGQTSGTYNSKDVATATTVSATLAAGDFTPSGGALATNYTLPTSASGPGHITPQTLTAAIIGDPTKVYDGNTNATLAPANFSLTGLVGSESFSVGQTSGTYNSKDVATASTVNATLAVGHFTPSGGALATNYTLPTSASGPGHITPATLTAAIIGDPTKVYDGNTNATLTSANFDLTGLVGSEDFTVTETAGTYNTKDVATANQVTATLGAGDFTPVSGAIASNYTLPTTAAGAGHITPKTVTGAIIGDPTKVYDGNTNATLAPANFQLTGLVGSETFSVTQTAGTYNTKDVATANLVSTALGAGDFTPLSGAIASNYTLPTTASGSGHITPQTVTGAIIGDPTKIYDGNTNATLAPANFQLTGLVGSETFSVTQTAGTYNTKDVATANQVTASLGAGDFTPLSGAIASNYTLPTSASGPGHITPATVAATIIGDPTKVYDGNTNATLAPANFDLTGLVSSEDFTVTETAGTYNTKDVATANTVSATLAAGDFTPVSGAIASNYTLPTSASGPGHITPQTVTGAIIGDPTKVYDGNTNATLAPANFDLTDLVGSEDFTVTETAGTYNTKDVATANTVSATLAAGDFIPVSGAIASNYTLPSSASGPGHITPATVAATIIGDPTKVYDGNTNATLTPANFSLTGLVGSESFSVGQTSGTYNSKDVTTASTVNATLAAGHFTPSGGALATNYTLPTSASGPGHITPATLTAAIIGDPTKVYDGNTNAALTPANFSLTGLVGSESFSVGQTSGTYNSKDVTTASTVNATLAAGHFTPSGGALATNYTLPTSASGPGHITPATLTAAIIGDPTKVYDGNTNAALTPANFSLTGLVGSESFSVGQTAGTYNSKDVATATTVNATLASGHFTPSGGALATNYTLPTSASGAGHVTPATLTAAIIGDPTKVYDGNTNATLAPANFDLTGLVGSEDFTVTETAGTYNTKDVATANTVSATLGAGDFAPVSGAIASNYTLPTSASGPGHITPQTVTGAIIGDPTKVYDGNTNATLAPANFQLTGLVGSESFSVTETAGTYNSKDVVTATTVSATLAAGDFTPSGGAIATNYTLPASASGPGHITEKSLTAAIILDPTKVYDTNTNATLTPTNFSLSTLVAGEAISVTKTSGTYNSPNVVTANLVTTTLAGGDFSPAGGTLLSNYTLPTTASGAGHVTAMPLSVSFVSDSRNFGNVTPPALTFSVAYSAFAGSENESVLGGSLVFTPAASTFNNTTFAGIYPIGVGGLTATNYAIGFVPGTFTLVDGTKPVVSLTAASPNPVAINTPINITANVSDDVTGHSNIASACYRIDGGTCVPMSGAPGSFSVNVSATIPASSVADVFEVCVYGTDAAGNTNDKVDCVLIARYDPNAGFVTGGGWIDSPLGAYVPNASLVGKATFGFVAKYKKGQSTPEGNTEFQFHAAGMNFKSTAYEWLVVAGNKAQYKGTGTLNGAAGYTFMLSAIDGDASSGAKKPDTFRMKITVTATGAVVYDNKLNAPDTDDPTTMLGGGSIVIHAK